MARTKLTLQDVARAAADKNGGKGGRGLKRLAEAKGLTLSYTTVDRILQGKYESTPQRQTIEALAVLAEMPLEEVYEAAGVPLPVAPFAEQLPEGSDNLSTHQRRVVLDVIRGFIRDNRRIDDLEEERDLAPLHPDELLRRASEVSVRELDDGELDWWHSKLALTELGDERDKRSIREFFGAVQHELRTRQLVRQGDMDPAEDARDDLALLAPDQEGASDPVAGDAQRDGLTADDDGLPPAERGGGLNAQISRAKSATSTWKARTTK